MCANSFLIMFLAGVRCGVMLSSGSSVVGDPMSFWTTASWWIGMPLVIGADVATVERLVTCSRNW